MPSIRKDVDGFHPENAGLMLQGRPRFLPCTPSGVMQLLRAEGVPTAGRHAVVIGRSDIVGKPMAALLLQKGRRRHRDALPQPHPRHRRTLPPR
ncbi:MAG UNVERIFIED_CONTAM: hypothetical protein LVR18_12575 [Planctomycetaceae bacterium]|jgi:methylenetetrahydrofolate dehydrogenase (NADP+)/methenyltetrahydrofolate cyclohydrolase